MQNEMRDRLVKLLGNRCCSKQIPCEICEYQNFGDCHKYALADDLIEHGVIVPPCKVGETLYVVQIDYEGNYFMTTITDVSKITMLSILRAYEERTVVYMSTDREEAEKALKERENNA